MGNKLLKGLINYPDGATNKQKEQIIMELINRRRHQLLVHSIIYYRLNENLIHDKKWDLWARQLVALQKRFPKTSRKVKPLYSKFEDFDASTGFHLCGIDDEESARAEAMAMRLIEYSRQQENDCEGCYVETLNKRISKTHKIKLR